jgi:hypothetical protein
VGFFAGCSREVLPNSPLSNLIMTVFRWTDLAICVGFNVDTCAICPFRCTALFELVTRCYYGSGWSVKSNRRAKS